MNNWQSLTITAGIVAAFVGRNEVEARELSGLIESVHASVSTIISPLPMIVADQVPFVPVKMSITNDYLICLESGKKFRTLQRHLAKLGMTPDEYRAKWRLPHDYPMTSAGYSAMRSVLAIANGFGARRRKRVKPADMPGPAEPANATTSL